MLCRLPSSSSTVASQHACASPGRSTLRHVAPSAVRFEHITSPDAGATVVSFVPWKAINGEKETCPFAEGYEWDDDDNSLRVGHTKPPKQQDGGQ